MMLMSMTIYHFQSTMNPFVVQEVAAYVGQQIEAGIGGDLLVCAGSSASKLMSKALVAMWCPAFRVICAMADITSPPDALIIADLSSDGLTSLAEYVYTGQSTCSKREDYAVIKGDDLGHYVDITLAEVEQGQAGEGGVMELDDVTTDSSESQPTKQVAQFPALREAVI